MNELFGTLSTTISGALNYFAAHEEARAIEKAAKYNAWQSANASRQVNEMLRNTIIIVGVGLGTFGLMKLLGNVFNG